MATVLEMPATTDRRMTLEEFRALPDDPTVERELRFGRLKETAMARRNRKHAGVMTALAAILHRWSRLAAFPGQVFTGDIGCDLPEVEGSFGIDVAVFSDATLKDQNPQAAYIVGAPILAVEIHSPSDTVEDVHGKLDAYLAAGVPKVWIIDPADRTVRVYRPNHSPKMFVPGDMIADEPTLPGLELSVSELFESLDPR